MNLISCGACGVVLDISRIDMKGRWEMKEEVDDESFSFNNEHFHWAGDDYKPSIRCPACKAKISGVDGDEVP